MINVYLPRPLCVSTCFVWTRVSYCNSYSVSGIFVAIESSGPVAVSTGLARAILRSLMPSYSWLHYRSFCLDIGGVVAVFVEKPIPVEFRYEFAFPGIISPPVLASFSPPKRANFHWSSRNACSSKPWLGCRMWGWSPTWLSPEASPSRVDQRGHLRESLWIEASPSPLSFDPTLDRSSSIY